MNKIEVQDERIDQVVKVALENIKVSITEAKPQTFTTINDKDEEVEVVLNIKQPPVQTTLKDTEAEISDLEIKLSQAQAQVENLTTELQKKRDVKVELEDVIKPAHEALMIAVEAKAGERISNEVPDEMLVEEKLPTEEIIKP